jgi:D-3-phosphoglycerate dehydrogenase / 2-oxoglutarate reductase
VNILLVSPIDPEAIDVLRREHEVECSFGADGELLRSLLPDREVLVFRSGVTLSSDVLAAGGSLRFVIRAGSGLDNVDLEQLRDLGIRMVRIPGPSAQAVAEFTFALMLDLARNVSLADRLLREGHWPKPDLLGGLISGKTLGVVGAGNIGSRVGELGAAWGMRVLGCVEFPSAESEATLRGRGIQQADFEAVVSEADFLTLHVPLQSSTRNLIDERALSLMKPGSFLVNAARGGVVDEDALYRQLAEGRTVAGAALDVHEQEGEGTVSRFANLPNVVLTPHIGGMARESQHQIGRRVIEFVDSFVRGDIDTTARNGELLV